MTKSGRKIPLTDCCSRNLEAVFVAISKFVSKVPIPASKEPSILSNAEDEDGDGSDVLSRLMLRRIYAGSDNDIGFLAFGDDALIPMTIG
jgi:hypothetical protein